MQNYFLYALLARKLYRNSFAPMLGFHLNLKPDAVFTDTQSQRRFAFVALDMGDFTHGTHDTFTDIRTGRRKFGFPVLGGHFNISV